MSGRAGARERGRAGEAVGCKASNLFLESDRDVVRATCVPTHAQVRQRQQQQQQPNPSQRETHNGEEDCGKQAGAY